MIQMMNFILFQEVNKKQPHFYFSVLIVVLKILTDNTNQNLNHEQSTNYELQKCYNECFHDLECEFFSFHNECSFINQLSYENCNNSIMCVKMNGNFIF